MLYCAQLQRLVTAVLPSTLGTSSRMALRLPDLMVASSSKSSSKDRHAFAFPWSKGKRVAAATANEAPTPKPGIRVSSLGTSRRPGSLQRSLSSPASLRSLSLWHEAVSQQAEPLPSLDCVVGPSRYVEVERPGEGAERLVMPPDHSSYYSSADYWASTVAEEPLEPPNQLFVSPTMTHSDSRGSFRTAQEEEEDDLELAEDPYATLLGLGVALNELPAVLVDPSVTSPHPAAATERETTAAVEVVVSAGGSPFNALPYSPD